MDKKGKGSICNKVIKGAARGEAGVPCKGKSVGKEEEIEESRGERGGVHG